MQRSARSPATSRRAAKSEEVGAVAEPEDSAAHPGTPDGFERLWTPHRMVYIKGENKPASPEKQECPFCAVQ